jgi:hypothetical protein
MVTTVILGLVAIGITSLFVNIQRTQLHTRYLESATYAAQTEIESLRNINYNNLVPGSTIDFTSSLPNDLPHNATGSVAVSEPVSGLRRVDVQITYTYSGSTRLVKLTSLIGELGITQ